MKRKQFIFILVFIGIAVTLSACAGAANTATSWPGLTVDDQYAYVAYNTRVYAVAILGLKVSVCISCAEESLSH